MPDTSLKARYTSVLSADDRAVLEASWRAEPVLWSYETSQKHQTTLNAWLGPQTPAEWHDIILGFNWDYPDYSLPLWIAGQADADQATVMTMVLALDIAELEHDRIAEPGLDPHIVWPEAAELLDRIAEGFASGAYQASRYGLGFSSRFLVQTHLKIARLGQAPFWRMPRKVWEMPKGVEHSPDFVWDAQHQGQRLNFERWLQLKVRPH